MQIRTRFDDTRVWRAHNDELRICEMETDHLINTLNMFVRRPERTLAMLVRDIEHFKPHTTSAWTRDNDGDSIIKESLRNVTSMTYMELMTYALNAPLGKAMIGELEDRGVNMENLITEVLNANNLEFDN